MTVDSTPAARERHQRQAPALRVRDLVVRYGGRRDAVHAVDGVDIDVARGTTLGVIGESGSGKSTLAKAIAGLVPVTAGTIAIAGPDGDLVPADSSVGRGGQVQMIFQDPVLALNPGRPVWKSVVEPLTPHRPTVPRQLRDRAVELLGEVGLGPEIADRRPGQMSGGQRQRVTIARAVASRAPLIMCDEPVAALDISLQAGVLRLLDELRAAFDLTYVFISHDMSSIARIAHDVGVMYLGRLVEIGPAREVLQAPRHPYTQALIRAVPRVAPDARGSEPHLLEGEIPDARRPPSGCRFRTRCPFAQDICVREEPRPETVDESEAAGGSAHRAACHFWREIRAGTAARSR
ncbi:peptide/nickel transport system ATP-binding protein [Actinomadura meyerae]|uniref:Peptide/nickel transport system ATP-binding protein n=1 Tax=Actinomadura meyerae TaxID=240840 RepID=A0A239NUZ6_9ACTN|nr:ABC transporter ATP-binding protein [Actinomadura meyerae]SNT58532.1 peptide/nickel transport system ATP-binding protein [Actinomadura meyerae]